ncbi:hypothetical protein ABPG72_009686 [Tetrahymena utriculariae]
MIKTIQFVNFKLDYKLTKYLSLAEGLDTNFSQNRAKQQIVKEEKVREENCKSMDHQNFYGLLNQTTEIVFSLQSQISFESEQEYYNHHSQQKNIRKIQKFNNHSQSRVIQFTQQMHVSPNNDSYSVTKTKSNQNQNNNIPHQQLTQNESQNKKKLFQDFYQPTYNLKKQQQSINNCFGKKKFNQQLKMKFYQRFDHKYQQQNRQLLQY